MTALDPAKLGKEHATQFCLSQGPRAARHLSKQQANPSDNLLNIIGVYGVKARLLANENATEDEVVDFCLTYDNAFRSACDAYAKKLGK